MDYFEKLIKQVSARIFIGNAIVMSIAIICVWLGLSRGAPAMLVLVISLLISLTAAIIIAKLTAKGVTEPVWYLWKAILHVAPGHKEMLPPDIEKAKVGRELVSSLALQVYQLATTQTAVQATTTNNAVSSNTNNILGNLPLPVIVLNREQAITYVNPAAITYVGQNKQDIVGTNLNSLLSMSFDNTNTFDAWLQECQTSKATDSHSWERVQVRSGVEQTKHQVDLAAYYNKNNSEGAETILTLFDKTGSYSKDNDDLSFISLAVHELRTPLTILRGYIEVLQDELEGKLDPEMSGFMQKLQFSAQQLSGFVSNILNVARVEENQLFLQLHEEDWSKTLTNILSDMALRAKVHNKKLEVNVQPNLPKAAVDSVSMYEVVGNLIDNAIKYSGKSDRIIVRTYLKDDGMIETTIQDFGIGISSSVIGRLFDKFYRNHRSRAQVGGTGLGLYLSKAIVNAHGGHIWVQSKEGQGSIFGFTLQQYSQLADKSKTADNTGIQRTAHGWIKNHSFYSK